MVHGLPHLEDSKNVCEGCMLGKQHRDEFQENMLGELNCHLNWYTQISVVQCK